MLSLAVIHTEGILCLGCPCVRESVGVCLHVCDLNTVSYKLLEGILPIYSLVQLATKMNLYLRSKGQRSRSQQDCPSSNSHSLSRPLTAWTSTWACNILKVMNSKVKVTDNIVVWKFTLWTEFAVKDYLLYCNEWVPLIGCSKFINCLARKTSLKNSLRDFTGSQISDECW